MLLHDVGMNDTYFWTAGKIIAAGSLLLLLDVFTRATVFLAVVLILCVGVPWFFVSCIRDNLQRAKLRRAA
jgi:hypothetical protein